MPPLGALVISRSGYGSLFIVTAVLFLLPLWFIWKKIPEEKLYAAPLGEEIKKYRGLRTITFLEGALHFFVGVIVAVYTLLFFQRASEIGWFLSYLAIISFIIAMFLSRHSDQTQQRKKNLFLLFFTLTFSILSLALVKSTTGWLIAISIFTVIYAISSPLRLAVSMDVKKTDIGFWKTREIFLNMGRVVTLSISAVLFYYQMYWAVFVMFGVITLVYPFLVNYKLKEIQ